MLCSLADFVFESSGVNLDSIKQTRTYRFERTETIGWFDNWQSNGKHEQDITMGGVLIQKSQSTLEKLERIAERKAVITLAFENGKAFDVLIQNITTDKSLFLKHGEFLKQDFEITLGVVNGLEGGQ